ncbi:hypothetical protein EOB36_20415 [Mesorhizobium sp. M6A.T.Cr.TU.017.01.1.1]|uniref:hypothetical protein n=1 Tax=Mesorhizobium sp. M6A.T.Cr.TU.017.01.1.1 TaxID=2496774 RepID=UPI000FD46E9B|nr:hypothetical protein [Mesorhizobium sp. M6A.T.Cr.TU.017.01.1.1]RUU99443.1 hypothetical protein EOB36_20415 [Mesorhizobium sp. M6A.T.Cr.TU.017.01.1.1]
MKWTAENKAEAARLWSSGMTGTEIAGVVGSSPEELYGLARRNPVLFRPRGHGKTRFKRTAAPPQVESPAPKPFKVKFPEKAPGYPGVPNGRLTSCGCEFPLWGHHEEFDVATSLFCGAPRIPESRRPYCTFHAIATAGTGTPVERRAVRDAIVVGSREAVAA